MSYEHKTFNPYKADYTDLETLGYALAELHPSDTPRVLPYLADDNNNLFDVLLGKTKSGEVKSGLVAVRKNTGNKEDLGKYTILAVGADDLKPIVHGERADKKASSTALKLINEFVSMLDRRHLGKEKSVRIETSFRPLQYMKMWREAEFSDQRDHKQHIRGWIRGLREKTPAEIQKIEREIRKEKICNYLESIYPPKMVGLIAHNLNISYKNREDLCNKMADLDQETLKRLPIKL